MRGCSTEKQKLRTSETLLNFEQSEKKPNSINTNSAKNLFKKFYTQLLWSSDIERYGRHTY